MKKCWERFFVLPWAAGILLAAAMGVLGTAFVAQFVFHHQPCVLCLWQRVPYAAVMAVAGVAMVWRVRWMLGLCAVVLLVGAGLAVFHSGVERHWWEGTAECVGAALHGASAAELREELLKTPVVRCDEITWTFLGLSFANWNILTSLGLAGFAGLAARRKEMGSPPARG